jgi:ubiquinone biosynthesis protein COQ4
MHAAAAMDTSLKPFMALRAVRALMADPEDTAQVFSIFRALRGRSSIKAFRRFQASVTGAALLRDRRVLRDTLANRAALSALPAGSLGRTYFAFMEDEKLTTDGLVQASQDWDNDPVPADMQFYRERQRDAHDLTHTLTGYGRDPLGELCLLAFMYAHTRNLGMAFIVGMNWLRLPGFAKAAVREAWRNGKKARWMQDMDWEALLPRPLDDVRRDCAIPMPLLYRLVQA